MTEHQDLLTLVGETDPFPEDSAIPEAWIDQRPPIERIIDTSPTLLIGSRSRPGLVVALASAAVIVVVVGGLALLLRSEQLEPADQPTVSDTPVTTVPPPSTTVPPSTTTVPPESSALGELTWASFPNELPPDIVAIVDTDHGFVAASPTELWTSADRISWTPGPLPFTPSGDVSMEKDATGTYWIVHNSGSALGAVGLWRSDDAVSWSQVDTSAIRLPSLSGVDWGVFPQKFFFLDGRDWESPIMVSNRDTILASWRIIGSVPWQEILGFEEDGELDTSWNLQSQVLELTWRPLDPESETLGAAESVRLSLAVVSEDPVTIQATDVDTGALVHTIIGRVEGFSTDQLMAGIADGFNIDVVGVSDDGRTFEAVPTPWAVSEVGSFMLAFDKYPRIVASGGRFYAYSVDVNGVEVENEFRPESGTVETWTSTDGRTWTSAGTPSFAEGQDVTGVTAVLERDGVFVVAVELIDSNQKLWQSQNGIDWARIERGPTTGGHAHRAESGWVFTASVSPATGPCCLLRVFAIWVSQDGNNWQPVDIDSVEGLSEPGLEEYEAHVAGDTIFVFNRFFDDGPEDPSQGTVWIATLND